MLIWNDFSLMQPQTKEKEKPSWLNQFLGLKQVCNFIHLSRKQFHKIVKGDFTFLGNIRNLSLKLVCNLKHLTCKQFHKIVKGDFTILRNLRNLQKIQGLNRLSKQGFCFVRFE